MSYEKLYEKLPVPLAGGNYFRHFVGNGRGGGNLVHLFVGKVLPTGLNIPAIRGPDRSIRYYSVLFFLESAW